MRELPPCCLLIGENANNGLLLQRELAREFPQVQFQSLAPFETWDQAIAGGLQPSVCVVDLTAEGLEPEPLIRKIQTYWPNLATFVIVSGKGVHDRLFGIFAQGKGAWEVGCSPEEVIQWLRIKLKATVLSVADEGLKKGDLSEKKTSDEPVDILRLLDTLPFGVALIHRRTMRIHFINHVLERWLGVEKRGMRMLLTDLHSGDDAKKLAAAVSGKRQSKADSAEDKLSVHGRGGLLLDVLLTGSLSPSPDLIAVMYLDATERRAVERKLRRMADAVASAASGREFFRNLVSGLARVLEVDIASVCRLEKDNAGSIRSLAMYVDGQMLMDQSMDIQGSPVELVLKHQLICITRHFRKEFPEAAWMLERQVESYMGLPVTDAEGQVIGMIQIMHRRPFARTKDFRAVLLVFAVRVAAEMTRLADEEALGERERMLVEAEKISGMGSWEWCPIKDRFVISQEGLRIIGLAELPSPANLEWAVGLLHEADRLKARNAVRQAETSLESFEDVFRLERPSGERRWLQVRGRLIPAQEGRGARMAGIFLDVTEKRKMTRLNEAFSRLGHLLSSAKTKLDAARTIVNVAGQMLEVDAAAFELRDGQSPGRFETVLNVDTVDGVLKEFSDQQLEINPTPLQLKVIQEGGMILNRQKEGDYGIVTIPFGVVSQPSKTIMVVPIRHEAECIGILSVHSYRAQAYAADDLATLQALADYSAGALLRVDAEENAANQQQLLQLVMDSLPASVAYVDREFHHRLVNREYEKTFGRSRGEIEGMHVKDLLAPQRWENELPFLQRVMKGQSIEHETALDTSHPLRHFQVNYVPHIQPGGGVIGFISLTRDISALRSAELELRENIVRTQAILDSAAAVVFTKDLEGRYTLVNKLWEKMMGLDRASVIGKRTEELHGASVAGPLMINDRRVLDTGVAMETEEVVCSAGQSRTFLSIKFPLVDTQGKTYGLCGIATDITRRKGMEQSLLQLTHRLKTAQRISHVGNWEYDMLGGTMWWSDEVYRLFGLQPEPSCPGWDAFLSMVHPEDLLLVRKALDKCMKDRSSYCVLHRIVRPDGEVRHLRQHGEVVLGEDDRVKTIVGAVQDVTTERLTELALRESEEKFRILYQAMPLPTFIWKAEGRTFLLKEGNPAAVRFTQNRISEILGRSLVEVMVYAPGFVEEFERCYREQASTTCEVQQCRMLTIPAERHLRLHLNYVAPDLVVMHIDDMTEANQVRARKQALLQLIPFRVFRLDGTGVFLDYFASRVEEMLLDPATVIGRNFREVLPRDTADIIDAAMQRARVTGQVQTVYYTLHKNGRQHFLEGKLIHCGNAEFLAVVQDIEESQYRKARAQESHGP